MNVKISELNKRISIVEVQQIQDEYGFTTEQEIEVCKCWASIRNRSGNEIFKSNSDFSKLEVRFLIRHRKDVEINNSMTIKFNNNKYNIVYVNNYNYSNEFIEIIAEKIENV